MYPSLPSLSAHRLPVDFFDEDLEGVSFGWRTMLTERATDWIIVYADL